MAGCVAKVAIFMLSHHHHHHKVQSRWQQLLQTCEMWYIPLKAIVEAMSSLREFARVASLPERRAIAAAAQKRRAWNASFAMI